MEHLNEPFPKLRFELGPEHVSRKAYGSKRVLSYLPITRDLYFPVRIPPVSQATSLIERESDSGQPLNQERPVPILRLFPLSRFGLSVRLRPSLVLPVYRMFCFPIDRAARGIIDDMAPWSSRACSGWSVTRTARRRGCQRLRGITGASRSFGTSHTADSTARDLREHSSVSKVFTRLIRREDQVHSLSVFESLVEDVLVVRLGRPDSSPDTCFQVLHR